MTIRRKQLKGDNKSFGPTFTNHANRTSQWVEEIFVSKRSKRLKIGDILVPSFTLHVCIGLFIQAKTLELFQLETYILYTDV